MCGYVDLLTNRNQGGTLHHAVAGGYADAGDLAVTFGGDVVFHLHGFKHENGLALLDALAHGHQNLGYHTCLLYTSDAADESLPV